MAELRQNTWTLDEWYAQAVAGTTGGYVWGGSLYAWGTNPTGSLGQNNTTKYSSPVQVGTNTTWKFSSMSKRHAMAIKTDGTLWAWGRGMAGGLGLNSNTERSSPTQIGTRTNWKTCASRTYGGAATTTPGQLYSWGYNPQGQVGDNTTTQRSSPIQIPGSWTCVDTGGDSMQSVMALRTNGQLWAWGYNGFGQLGQGNTTQYSSPKQVPGSWNIITTSGNAMWGIK